MFGITYEHIKNAITPVKRPIEMSFVLFKQSRQDAKTKKSQTPSYLYHDIICYATTIIHVIYTQVAEGQAMLIYSAAGGVRSLLCQWADKLATIVIGYVY